MSCEDTQTGSCRVIVWTVAWWHYCNVTRGNESLPKWYIDWCFTVRQHRIGRFVQCCLRWLKIADSRQYRGNIYVGVDQAVGAYYAKQRILSCNDQQQKLFTHIMKRQWTTHTNYNTTHNGLKKAGYVILAYLRGRLIVAEWLTHSPATLEVTGSRPTFSGISEICFLNRYGL